MDELLNAAPCGFLSFRNDGTIVLVNDTLLQQLGFTSDQLMGQHIERVLSAGTRIFYHTHWFPLVRMHGHAEEIFMMLRDARGEELGMLANCARRSAGGEDVYDCVFMRVRERQKFEDELVRARNAAEQARRELMQQATQLQETNELLEAQTYELEVQQQQLEEVSQAKSTFLAVMSHELRTPLNAISGYTDLIDMGIHGPVTDGQKEALDRIRQSQRRLLRLINDILNLSRIESGHVDYVIEDLDLAEVMDEVAPLVAPQMAEKGITFEAAVERGHRARGDREKVQQILLNLLSNAVKFTPDGGRVTVSMPERADAGDFVFIAVTDNGPGIPRDKLASVFEPFIQVDTSPAHRKEGTGLGLAISRDLARGMGGDLRARSEPGTGSTFTLALPRAG